MKFLTLFTRKPKRSEWMEGVLFAEEYKKEGYSSSGVWGSMDDWDAPLAFEQGISDYLHHSFHRLENK